VLVPVSILMRTKHVALTTFSHGRAVRFLCAPHRKGPLKSFAQGPPKPKATTAAYAYG